MMPHLAPTASPTAALLDELALYGVRPNSDEPDFRPLPDLGAVEGGIASMVEAIQSIFVGTRLEDEVEEVLWSVVNIFHRRLTHSQKRLDDNEGRQRTSLAEHDGSEVKSVELEKLVTEGLSLTESRNAFEAMRDVASEHYRVETGSAWLPRTGSKVSHRALTAAVIDSRNFISAKRRSEIEVHCPAGTRIAFTGGDYQDYDVIWKVLDQTHAKHPDMILLHGGTPNGAELIAAKWADARGVTQVAFKPDWKAHRKAAPFKRNDALLETMPIGVIAAPGTGITDNLVDKARKLGIPVKRIGNRTAP
ncbi:DUF2493 domain-containing protein [Sinorhizobium meliloti]|uniref:YspA cpYpsA-related SLOG domain-containing protein n=1 Tax=Rhizobium meliloti TaxID=382 RepID=A0A2J0YWX4_RHIML|nr:DUF2493 domain-containing protein [Sinorhizobium meliloti]PJR12782.1 hypothetical protein CEJ86_24690 [Sinorhizobium meliloti]